MIHLKLFEEYNRYIYHGTSKVATLIIQKEGLKPYNTGEDFPSISLTKKLEYAEYYAESKRKSRYFKNFIK